MHIVCSWDIAASGDRWNLLNQHLRGAFDGGRYSWARPISTFYVVKINESGDRDAIADEISSRAKSVSEEIEFLVSPVMYGDYVGMLKTSMWPKVNERTR